MNKAIKEEFSRYQEPFLLARVSTVHKTQYLCIVEEKQYSCTVSGRFKYLTYQKSDYPVVGDYVIVNPSEYENSGIIERVCSRYSSLDRLGVSKTQEKQVLASNIDIVFVCMSMNNDFNIKKLRRFLSLGYASGAETIIVLTKSDLVENHEYYINEARRVDHDSPILTVSVENPNSIQQIGEIIKEKTGVFLGSSGVGKSTIVNELLKEEYLKTKTIRKSDAQGRHTTSHRELIQLPNGGYVIDTPGIRTVDSYVINDIESAYEQVTEAAKFCKFQNCTHDTEPGCYVKEQLESGDLEYEIFESYKNTLRLNRYNEKREQTRAKMQNKRKKS